MRIVVTQLSARSRHGASAMASVALLPRRFAGQLTAGDIVLLPELVGGDAHTDAYEAAVQDLAHRLGAWVVGGSHLAPDPDGVANIGIVADPAGRIAGRYGKLNPYGEERERVTKAGLGPLRIQMAGQSCLVMICADFWHTSAFPQESGGLDLILVPAFSASQRRSPHMARARWRHAAVARAYEHSAFVAVSDWAHPVPFGGLTSSGVAGLARPNPDVPADLYSPLGRRRAVVFDIAFDTLHDLRANRRARGFELAAAPGPPSSDGDGAPAG